MSIHFHVEGEKCGVCIRCSAIYFGFLAGLLLLPLSGALKRLPFPKPALIIAFMIPMVVDVVLSVTGVHLEYNGHASCNRYVVRRCDAVVHCSPVDRGMCTINSYKNNQSLNGGVRAYGGETQ